LNLVLFTAAGLIVLNMQWKDLRASLVWTLREIMKSESIVLATKVAGGLNFGYTGKLTNAVQLIKQSMTNC